MPRIPAHTVHDAPPGAHPLLATLLKQQGKILNIQAHMGHAPVVIAVYAGIKAAIAEHGTFDARTREAIALTVAAVDACGYCQSVHTMMGKAAGWSEEQTVAIRAADPVEPRIDALLAVVRQATGNVGEVEDQTWADALAAGWTSTELTEAFAHISINLFTNYFNHYVGTELDSPAAPGIGSLSRSAG